MQRVSNESLAFRLELGICEGHLNHKLFQSFKGVSVSNIDQGPKSYNICMHGLCKHRLIIVLPLALTIIVVNLDLC
jgi:hypothetical protein